MPSSKLPIRPRPNTVLDFEAIGTVWQIQLFEQNTFTAKLEQSIHSRIEAFDKTYSRFRADSLVTTMSHRSGEFILPEDGEQLMEFYKQLYTASKGLVTPLIGQVLNDAGYDAAYSLLPTTLSQPPKWDEVLSYQSPVLTIKQAALLDFGAAGKGYLVDIISQMLETLGIKDYCVDAGGDMRYRSTSSTAVLKIGLEHPERSDEVIGVAEISNQSICGSSGNRRAWQDYNHIIDPRALVSPRHIAAVWAVAGTTMLADGMTTALYFAPAHELQLLFSFEYAIMYTSGELERSARFPASFFTQDSVTE